MPRILLVDDDDLLRNMLRIMLEKMGHDVFETPSGEAALVRFRQNPPDVMITDLIMPGKEGLEIISEFRSMHPTIKIVAMSGADRIVMTNYLEIALTEGADAILAKPFTKDELAAVLSQIGFPPAGPKS